MRRTSSISGIAIAAALAAAAPSVAGAAVTAYPSPGTHLASPATQISLRGVAPAQVGAVTVTGSKSGPHSGRIAADSDGRGASFLPDKPFTPGETVTVATALPVVGAHGGAFQIGIATPGPPLRPVPVPPPLLHVAGIQRFHSRHDLAPPAPKVTTSKRGAAPGDLFAGVFPFPGLRGPGQRGPMVLDPQGRLIWFHPLKGTDQALDVRVQQYAGQPVLTWWQGFVNAGVGAGAGVVFDRAYRRIALVQAGNGLKADPHEFLLTPRGTALLVAEQPVVWDLSAIHGAKRAVVYDSVVQEVDIKTGLVLFEWHSLDHVNVAESHIPPPRVDGHLYDYFHINSVAQLGSGGLLVSARNTWGVYKLDQATGAVDWRLGGKRSSFKMGAGTEFAWQHDARAQADGTITIFDDGGAPPVHTQSRAIGLRIDTRTMRAALDGDDKHTPAVLANSQGNAQLLPGGDTLVGWGSAPLISEFSPRGTLLFDLRFPAGDETYRAYRFPWSPQPQTLPALAASSDGKGHVRAYVSWNGSSNVARWELLAGASATTLAPVASVRRSGFETATTLRTREPLLAVQARDSAGRVLATSTAIAPERG